MNDNSLQQLPSEGMKQELSLREYVQILLREKWIILSTIGTVLAITVYLTATTTPLYESSATVLINTKGQERALSFLDLSGGNAAKNIRNEIEILKSRALAEAVAAALIERKYFDDTKKEMIDVIQVYSDDGPIGTLAPSDVVISRIANRFRFEPVRDSDILKIIARSSHPEEAALLANTMAHVYSERNLEASRIRTRAVKQFLESQLRATQSVLATAEDSLQKYMQKTGVLALDQSSSRVTEQLANLEAQRNAADIELESASRMLETYKQQLEQLEPNVGKAISNAIDPYIRKLSDELARLEVQRDITIIQNPQVATQDIYGQLLKEIDAQIASLRAKLQQRTQEYLQSLLPGQNISGGGTDAMAYLSQIKQKILSIQIEQQALKTRKQSLNTFIEEYSTQFEQIPRQTIQFARLQRARLSSEKLFLLVEEKFSEAAISEQSEFGYVDIIDEAVPPASPVSPNAQRNYSLGALIGLGLGIALGFLRELVDVRIRTPEDLKKRGVNFLTLIESMNEELRRTGTADVAIFDGKMIDPHLLTLLNPLTPISEGFRRLRTNIQYARLDQPVRSLLVTSPNPLEGKSTVIANLAIVFAQVGKRVLLIDTDLRRPALHRKFDVNQSPGLCDFLFGDVPEDKIMQNSVIENLHLITSGSTPPNPSEVLGSKLLREYLQEKKKEYDLILFDSPPVLAVTDPVILSTLVDGVVIITFAGKTSVDTFEKSVETLKGVGAHLLGVVLNCFDLRKAYGSYYRKVYRAAYEYYGYRENGQEKGGTVQEKRKRSRQIRNS